MSELSVVRAGLVPYEQAWAQQREVHERRVAGTGPDTLLLLEHPPVYTAGKRTLPSERPFDGTPVIDVDRGGKITWHGPASWSATRSCSWPTRWTSSPTSGGSRRP
jgi:lipoyl(octanoyl) transferase